MKTLKELWKSLQVDKSANDKWVPDPWEEDKIISLIREIMHERGVHVGVRNNLYITAEQIDEATRFIIDTHPEWDAEYITEKCSDIRYDDEVYIVSQEEQDAIAESGWDPWDDYDELDY